MQFVNDELHAHPSCPEPIHKLLDFVMQNMLVVESRGGYGRARCSQVCAELNTLYERVADQSYQVVASPRPRTTAHTASTTVHTAGTTAHTAGTRAHTAGTRAHTTGTTAHAASTMARAASTMAHAASTMAHTAGTIAHTTGTTAHAASTMAHTASTTAHAASTMAHTASTSRPERHTSHFDWGRSSRYRRLRRCHGWAQLTTT
jgi:hypothetical protein